MGKDHRLANVVSRLKARKCVVVVVSVVECKCAVILWVITVGYQMCGQIVVLVIECK